MKFSPEQKGAALRAGLDSALEPGSPYFADEATLSRLREAIKDKAKEKGITYTEELQNYLNMFTGKIRPEIENRLELELKDKSVWKQSGANENV